jgi:magnesium transporter
MKRMDDILFTCESLSLAIHNKEYKKIRSMFDELNIVDAADVVNELATEDLLHLFKVLRKEIGAQLLTYLDAETIERLSASLQPETLQRLLEELYSDDLNEILSELPDELVFNILHGASPELRQDINAFLSFPLNSCGSIMSTDVITLKLNYTIEQAMRAIARQGRIAETIHWCYVIDDQRRLLGSIELKEILFGADETPIEALMNSEIATVRTHDDQEDAARLISRYDITAIPVLDSQNALVGIITVDDILDVVEEEATEDIHKMAAITPLVDSYLKTKTRTIVKARLPWLFILMVSATLTGSVIASYQELLILLPSLAIFIPMLMDTAGNAGSQAAAMVIRGIIIDDLGMKDGLRILLKEFGVSILIGLILFGVNTVRIGVFMPELGWTMAFFVSLSVVLVILMANVLGGMLPLIAVWFKLDPAAMAAPLITTMVDALALVAYFALATQLLRML